MSRSAEAYVQWLDISFSRVMTAFGENNSNGFDSLVPIHIAAKLPDSPAAITAICIPSCDKAGRRSPFTIFADVSNDLFDNHLSHLPGVHSLFYRVGQRALDSRSEAFRFEKQRDTLWTLEQTLRLDLGRSQAEFARFVAGTTVGKFRKSFKDQSGISDRIIENTVFALYSARENTSNQFQAIFRFPLSGEPDTTHLEIAFWTQLTEAVIGKPLDCQAIFWQQYKFDIVFQLPVERMLPLGWIDGIEDDNIWEFKMMDFESTPPDEVPAGSLGGIFDNEEICMAELIDKAGLPKSG